MSNPSRNLNIDVLKCVAALMVIVIHVFNATQGAETIAPFVMSITSWGVPYFFIASGFFFGSKNREFSLAPVTSTILRLTAIYITAIAFYFALDINVFANNDATFSIKFLLSGQPSARHLWFLLAMIFGYGVLCAASTMAGKITLMIASGCLVLIGLATNPYPILYEALGTTGQRILMLLFPHFLSIPFIYFGFWIARSQAQQKMKTAHTVVLMIAGAVLATAEAVVAYSHGIISQFYFGTYVLAAGVFLFSLSAPSFRGGVARALAMIGLRFSLPIYVYHLCILNEFSLLLGDDREMPVIYKILLNSAFLFVTLAAVFAMLGRVSKKFIQLIDGSAALRVIEKAIDFFQRKLQYGR